MAAETDTIMRCLSIQEMTLMGAQDLERDGAARRSRLGTIPETTGSVMAVERRATSKGIAHPEEPEEPEEEELLEETNQRIPILFFYFDSFV